MYRIRYVFVVIFLIIFCSCKDRYVPTKTNEFNSIIEFEEDTHNFGMILLIDTIGTVFKFKNKGCNPLIIRYVKTSCGYVIPEWPMDAIKPNQTGEIKVTYDANGKDSPQRLTIKGKVQYPK